MSMSIAFNHCNITRVVPSLKDDSTYVDISSINDDGSTSEFNFRLLGVPRASLIQATLVPIRLTGVVTGRIYGKDQKLTIANCQIKRLVETSGESKGG